MSHACQSEFGEGLGAALGLAGMGLLPCILGTVGWMVSSTNIAEATEYQEKYVQAQMRLMSFCRPISITGWAMMVPLVVRLLITAVLA